MKHWSTGAFTRTLVVAALLGAAAHAQARFNFTPNGSSDPTHQVELSGNPAKDAGGTAKVNGVGGRVWYKDDDGTIVVLNPETLQFEFFFAKGGAGPTGDGSNGATEGTWENIDYY